MAPPSSSHPKARRISYVIPPPTIPPKRLLLPSLDSPRNGRTAPLLLPLPGSNSGRSTPLADGFNSGRPGTSHSSSYFAPSPLKNPRHRLGVTALALDTTTVLSERPTPEGILYTGGRDGLVVAWEQGIPLRPRERAYGNEDHRRFAYHWESMTGWDAEETSDEEDEDWVDAAPSAKPIPYEQRWEADHDNLTDHSTGGFRQCVQAHTDWINDIILCNYNQTLISASNDGTLKAWNPHSTASSDSSPMVIGDHMDYVRCVVYSRERNWVASGSFDRTVKLWDLQQPRNDPLTTLEVPESASSAKASVYALATTPSGHVIAAGSPERVVRIWDPRSGKRVSKLVGHTDNIRALLLSDDGKYMLSGSSDASIKLWSLTAQKCLHTFSYHTDSVWALCSNHPSLETFYSGDRSGYVCKVDVEGCADIADGECVVLCKDVPEVDDGRGTDGINKIVAMDDLYVWTATGSSSIKRWSVPRRRADRFDLGGEYSRAESPAPPMSLMTQLTTPPIGHHPSRNDLASDATVQRGETPPPSSNFTKSHQARFSTQSSTSTTGTFHSINTVGPSDQQVPTLHGVPFQSLVRLALPHEIFPPSTLPRHRDTEIATLYSAVSIRSVPALVRNLDSTPRQTTPPIAGTGAVRTISSEMGVLTASSPPSIISPNRSQAVSPENQNYDAYASARDAYDERELVIDAVPLHDTPSDVIIGSHGLIRSVILNNRIHALTVDTAGEVAVWDIVRATCLGVFSADDVSNASNAGSLISGTSGGRERSPREALETVRERIEGESMCPAWATVDTKIGHLTVHLVESRSFDAETYADETGFLDARAFPDDHKLNIGKWVLTNLFRNFVRAEVDLAAQQQPAPPADPNGEGASPVTPRALLRSAAPGRIDLATTENRRLRSTSDFSHVMRTPGGGPGTPAMTPAVIPELPLTATPLPEISGNSPTRSGSATPATTNVRTKPSFIKENALTPIPASPLAGSATPSHPVGRTPSTIGKEGPDYFSGQKSRARSGSVTTDVPEDLAGVASGLVTPGGGFMGRLRNLGKANKRPTSGDASAIGAISEEKDAEPNPLELFNKSAKGQHLKTLNAILSQQLLPTPELEAPAIRLPDDIAVMISEESADASGWTGVYTSLVSNTQDDVEALEMASPAWLLELLLLNKAPTPSPVKISFIVVNYQKKGEPIQDSSRLTAGRILRIRKILQYVRDKLEPLEKAAEQRARIMAEGVDPQASPPPGTGATQLASRTVSQTSTTPEARAEDVYELLCNEMIVPNNMTIGAVKHYIWRQGGELMLHYRRKKSSVAPSA